MHQYNTNPNLFLEFFYLLRFSRSDTHKFFSPVYGKKRIKKKKINAPQKMKSLGNLLKRAQKKFERVSTTFFFASKTRFPTGKNSKSRTEVRDLMIGFCLLHRDFLCHYYSFIYIKAVGQRRCWHQAHWCKHSAISPCVWLMRYVSPGINRPWLTIGSVWSLCSYKLISS